MRILFLMLCLGLSAAGAAAQELRTLKPGDTLSISVLQDPKLDRTVTVDPLGEIAFPLAGHFRARGLTPVAVENILKSKLKGNYKDEALDVTVAVATAPKDIPEDDLKPRFRVETKQTPVDGWVPLLAAEQAFPDWQAVERPTRPSGPTVRRQRAR